MENIAPALLDWFYQNRRILPFREDPTPYHVWLSEIMLQQTRVSAALPYYERFLAALPDIPALAGCEEEKLHKLWEGLGYYSRVRNLQKAAKIVCAQYGGQLPADYNALLALPGIGEYTAGAIASISFGLPVPAVDGNVLRIAARLTACGENVLDTRTRDKFRRALADVMPAHRPGDFNQALMDLGAEICLPKKPKCDVCPAANHCRARAAGIQDALPLREKSTARPTDRLTVFVLTRQDGKTAIRRRGDSGLLAGLWEFPHAEGELPETLAAQQLSAWGLRVRGWRRTLRAAHQFTHRRWEMTGYLLDVEGDGEPDWLWADEAAMEAKAIPSAFKVFTAALREESSENQ